MKNKIVSCTWQDEAVCRGCDLSGELSCRWSGKLLVGFLLPALAFGLLAIFSIIIVSIASGVWWTLYSYLGFWFFFFFFFEIKILCSHCPYYAQDSGILHCLANHGVPKIWRFDPRPMNRFEVVSLYVGFIIFGFFPIGVGVYGIYFSAVTDSISNLAHLGIIGLTVAMFLVIIAFFSTLLIYICPRCVNFSCPFNRVEKEIVKKYLDKNPAMRDAWQKAGRY
ncbi:MAG TPA: hypothetical protein PKV16_06850 [Caldisericia bacterium]|nr:hypothetical protein [Caldisericia bacterium]HPF49485.1 hypothetical protein [Caldisericia bacterium]HPI84221.1 hypothetical protein [Caldisericia bacterium]HPQ93484.1 hypothetical protein [Caldisericia bacterium]HRV75510.1 hypothetical protein [Caldisericia bacterium]